MKFDIYDVIYVEDDLEDWKKLNQAVNERNQTAKSLPLRVQWAATPEKLDSMLSLSTRLVLADVYFPSNPLTDSQQVERLDDIIASVRRWSDSQRSIQLIDEDSQPPRLLPIIAYTRRSPAGLEYCLAKERRKYLYDIWDKSAASPEYAAWRLSEISKDLSRRRPDALSQRLIREMEKGEGASWHETVVDMTRRYDEGWSEQDQIVRAGASIEAIAFKLDVWNECGPMWNAMTRWEALSRAVSTKTRGHARHVINVFWLGYYLLNHKYLKNKFIEYWERLKINRKKMNAVKDDDPTEALCNTWFYAGLFHDVGGIAEKSFNAGAFERELNSIFSDIAPLTSAEWMTISQYLNGSKRLLQQTENELLARAQAVVGKSKEDFMLSVQPWLNEFDDPLIPLIRPIVENSITRNEPDQGVISALHLRRKINNGRQECYAREGARAISMHNLFPKLGNGTDMLPVSWENEPFVCLLLLCDQLQTWDRERGTEALNDSDQPSRAELSSIEISRDNDGRPLITISIDYIAPVHVDRSYELRLRVHDELTKVLHKNPYRALNRIQKPWPFDLHVQCTLSGERLEHMYFGGIP
jgi:hypothetical protein